jgi:hypothetical protein
MKQMNDTLSCRQVNDELMQHFDEGELRNLPVRLHAHLEACHQCQQEFTALCDLEKNLSNLPDADPGEAFWINFLPKLQRKLSEAETSRRVKDSAWAPALAMAAFFIVLAVRTPVSLAPPIWFQLQPTATILWDSESIGNGGFTNLEEDALAETVSNTDFVEHFLGEGSADLFEDLNEPPQSLPPDINDRIAALDETRQDAFFEKLKNLPIIES